MESAVRHPAVAGRFYPREPSVLVREVESYLSPSGKKVTALGCVAPHAGYVYSGHVAGAVYGSLDVPERCIVLCPNHTGMGKPLSIMSQAAWETPLGLVAADSSLAEALKKRFSLLSEDSGAHRTEHAIEVQLPFLQVCRKYLAFVPIALGVSQFEVLEALGIAIAEVVAEQNTRVLLVASSDMNHYENDAITRVKDRKAMDRILALDAAGLFEVVMREDISMCGFGPAVAMLTAAQRLGATQAHLMKYATSGDISGDRDQVVGYAGITVQ